MGRKRNRQRKRQNGDNVVWTELPCTVLEIIFDRLPLTDCISISDVCKSWRSVVAQELSDWQSRGIPWLMMSGQKDKKMRTCVSILQEQDWRMVLPEARGKYCWGSYQDWLFLVKDLPCFSIEITLLNPFSRKKTDLPKAWNFYHKMILSGLPSLEKYICILVGSRCRELAIWVPGAQSWLKHKLDGEPFVDGVFSRGSFYLLSKDDNVWEIKASNIYATIRTEGTYEIKTDCHEIRMAEEQEQGQEQENVLKYLVECYGEILLVCRFYSREDASRETLDFKVYSLDFGQMSWKRVHDLGDRILFLGKCCSRSISSRELGVQLNNCIYFSNDEVDSSWNEWDSDHVYGLATRFGLTALNYPDRRDWGVFRLSNEDNWRFCFRGNRNRWGPVWFIVPQWWCCRNLTFE